MATVLFCSYSKYSNLPERNLKKSQEIKHFLGGKLGIVILDPLFLVKKRVLIMLSRPTGIQ